MPGDRPQPAPPPTPPAPEAAPPPPQQPPAAPNTPATVDAAAREQGATTVQPLMEWLDAENLTPLLDGLRQTLGEFGIPRDSFESQRLLKIYENLENAIKRNLRPIRTWMGSHSNPNILVVEPDMQTLYRNATNNDAFRTPEIYTNFLIDSFFDFSQSGLSQSDILALRNLLKDVFEPIKEFLEESDSIQQRQNIISNMSEPVAHTLRDMQRNPQLTAYFSDTNLRSTMSLEALTPEQREAVMAFRVIEQRVRQEQQAAPTEGTAARTPETRSGSREREERDPIKFWKMIAIIVRIMMGNEDPRNLFTLLDDVAHNREPRRETPPAPAAPERPAVLATNSLFEGSRNLQVRDAPLMNGIIVNSATPFTMKTPLAGKVIRIRSFRNGNKELSLKVEETDTSYNVLKFAFTGDTNLTFSPRLGEGIGVEQAFNLATNVRSVGLNMERYRKRRGRPDERTLCAPSTIRDLYSLTATAPAAAAAGAPAATPAEGSQAAPAAQPSRTPEPSSEILEPAQPIKEHKARLIDARLTNIQTRFSELQRDQATRIPSTNERSSILTTLTLHINDISSWLADSGRTAEAFIPRLDGLKTRITQFSTRTETKIEDISTLYQEEINIFQEIIAALRGTPAPSPVAATPAPAATPPPASPATSPPA